MVFSRSPDFCAFSQTVLDRLVERALGALDASIIAGNDRNQYPHPPFQTEQKEKQGFFFVESISCPPVGGRDNFIESPPFDKEQTKWDEFNNINRLGG
ncbi:MAG: hypothetical protein R3D88_08355 [Alphaproteobacteria bacterium]|nr:hypothetical protein [Alphaproteobacteria bacterium]